MKKPQFIKFAFAAVAIGLTGAAHAGDVNVGINVGTPVVVAPPPPAVVVTPGWHGDRYWDGHRYWERDDWERHHHHDKHWHCPPGHAKKGEC
ncbi:MULTISPECIES: hypothetical protein [unclassified Paraburkholderia]|uniref:hypothetical protein n=1 Tax=unclassified Paraburkholderia TaxID=2615204 RepID=UPI002AB07A79|nr:MULTISPECIES: hypothetical protein [unclassified Paraburkholderia]